MSDVNNSSMLSSSASQQPLTPRNPASIPAPAGIELQAAMDFYDLAATAASYANDSITPVMRAIEALGDFDCGDIAKLRARIAMIKDLASVGVQLAHEMAADMEAHRNSAKEEMAALEVAAA